MTKWLIGVDEAGRGPLAGPVAVGVALVPVNFDWELISGVGDSKQLSAKKREEIFNQAKHLKETGYINYSVALIGARVIDQKGIIFAINLALHRALKKTTLSIPHSTTQAHKQSSFNSKETFHLGRSSVKASPRTVLGEVGERTVGLVRLGEVMVKLDGGLKAPKEYLHQETIIKGDSKEKVIGLASIMAKVTRDRYMERIADKRQFAPYDFTSHKGYGTKAHRLLIAKYGLSAEHRVSYCKNIKML